VGRAALAREECWQFSRRRGREEESFQSVFASYLAILHSFSLL